MCKMVLTPPVLKQTDLTHTIPCCLEEVTGVHSLTLSSPPRGTRPFTGRGSPPPLTTQMLELSRLCGQEWLERAPAQPPPDSPAWDSSGERGRTHPSRSQQAQVCPSNKPLCNTSAEGSKYLLFNNQMGTGLFSSGTLPKQALSIH